MSIISQIGRRSPRVRLFIAGMYAALIAGSVAMLYPFLLMVAGSTKSAVDAKDLSIVPRFLVDDLALYRKHIEGLFNESVDAMNIAYDTDISSFELVVPPAKRHPELVAAWRDFLRERPPPDYAATCGYLQAGVSKTIPRALREFKADLGRRFGDDIGAVNDALGTDFVGWNAFVVPPWNFLSPRSPPRDAPLVREVQALVARQPEGMRYYFSVDGYYRRVFLKAQYTRDIAVYNKAHGTSYASYNDVALSPTRPPDGDPARADWDTFVNETLNPLWVTSSPPRLVSVDETFRQTVDVPFAGMGAAQRELHYEAFLGMRSELRKEFATRNYRAVIDYMFLHGRGIVNTVVYCGLAVVLALLVNPLAAYAMSRYRMPSTYKVLLFLMLTMAFPPMVTQIPVFLMLRELGLLNTFAALLLPGLANGYSIFLLKGFFDAQPRDLYESAQLDGAGEWTLFWQITMSLARPILSVVALNAFVAAYANFMFALLICQDEKMWTLMVWLYQLQQRSGPAVLYASLIIAAVPTFAVFMLCQRVILRGIVVPVEK
ncbi:MAG TPA: carbohydrate ABC transporter permease [Kiritimatiellia bacterium]|jgi:multiple sugar transport system permease protein